MISLDRIDEAVRGGRMQEACRGLEELSRRGKWPQCDPVHLANLLWRTNSPARGARVLMQQLLEVTPSALCRLPEAAAEYGACLLRLGAFLEAEWILNLAEVRDTPMAPLYLGFARANIWDYPNAIPHFLRFVANDGLPSYWQRVGYTNLAAALVYEQRHPEAEAVLRRLMHDLQLHKNVFLAGFVLELAAGQRVLMRDYAEANHLLALAEKSWAGVDEYHRFLLDKWRALMQLSSKKDAGVLAPVREKARALQDWESVRDCDRYQAIWLHDEEKFRHVYFGTPFTAYRERLRKDFGACDLPDEYPFLLGEGKNRQDIHLLVDKKEKQRANPSSQTFALLALLATDFYRPHRQATLYGRLYPDQHFQARGVTSRINRALHRLEQWARKAHYPLKVREEHSTYALQATAPVTLWVPRPEEDRRAWQPLPALLQKAFGERLFSVSEAMKELDRPRSTMVRQLQSLVVSGVLQVSGKGPASRYRLVRLAGKAAA